MDELKQINVQEYSTQNMSTEETIPMHSHKNKTLLPLLIVGIVLGIGTGYLLAQKHLSLASGGKNTAGTSMTQNPASAGAVKVGDTFGTNDETTFKDQAEGVLQLGGIDGEGSHHIERGANKTQWVYLTSSVVDLDMFVGDKITIWGQTNQSKKAGWLMDVGKVKVLELGVAGAPTDTAGNQE